MIVRPAAAAALLWTLGLAWFGIALPRPAPPVRTDAIVALTGAPGRLPRGFALLGRGAAQRMLISGVNRRVRPAELAARYKVPPALMACCVDLGHESVDTRTNAEETAAWLAARRYRSVRLVTSDWHMARARFELARTLPQGVTLVTDATPSEPGLVMLVKEYNKYLLARMAAPFGY